MKSDKKVLFIEAKKLSVDVEQRDVIRQLAKYCFGEGMKYGVLTNGAIWILFRAFQEGTTMAERIVWKTDIENDGTTATIRRLNTISKENITDIENLIKKLQILDEIWHSLLDEPEQTEIEDFIKERVKELISPTEETVIEPIPIPEPMDWRDAQPRKMKVGTDAYDIRNSYDILVIS